MIFLPPFHFIWRLALICLLALLLIIVGCFMSCRWRLGQGEGLRSIFTTSIYVFVCLFIVCEYACLCVSVGLHGIHGIYTKDRRQLLQVSVISFRHLDPWDRSQVIRFGRKSLCPLVHHTFLFKSFLMFVSFTPSASCGPWKDSHWHQEWFLVFIVLEIEISNKCQNLYVHVYLVLHLLFLSSSAPVM